MKTAIEIIYDLEKIYNPDIEIEVFGVRSAFEIDEIVDCEIETWSDLDCSIQELEELAIDAIKAYVWSRDDLDRLEEYICRTKFLDFMYELKETLDTFNIAFTE